MFKLSSLWVFKYERLLACCQGQWTAETRISGKGLRLPHVLRVHLKLPQPKGRQAPGEEQEFLESYRNTDTTRWLLGGSNPPKQGVGRRLVSGE